MERPKLETDYSPLHKKWCIVDRRLGRADSDLVQFPYPIVIAELWDTNVNQGRMILDEPPTVPVAALYFTLNGPVPTKAQLERFSSMLSCGCTVVTHEDSAA